MSGWLDLTQLGLAPNQKHQALLGAPKIGHCGEQYGETSLRRNDRRQPDRVPEHLRHFHPNVLKIFPSFAVRISPIDILSYWI